MDTALYFMQGIPECMGLLALNLALARVPLRWGLITVAAVVLAVMLFIIRSLPISFGLHTIAALLVIVFALTKSTRTRPTTAFFVVIISLVLLMTLEMSSLVIVLNLLQIELSELMSNTLLWKLSGLPQGITLIVLALLAARYLRPEPGAWRF